MLWQLYVLNADVNVTARDDARNARNCSLSVWIMACVLQATSAVKLVDAPVLACDNRETLRKCRSLFNGRQGGSFNPIRS